MLFVIKEKDININKTILNSDGSFCCKEQNETRDFQVMLDNSGCFILNFNAYSKKCVSCEGHINNKKNILYQNLNIPNSLDGGLFIISDFDILKLGIEYKDIHKQMYFDKENLLFAIGDINTSCQFYRFGIGQYVAINDKQNIVAVIIKFNK